MYYINQLAKKRNFMKFDLGATGQYYCTLMFVVAKRIEILPFGAIMTRLPKIDLKSEAKKMDFSCFLDTVELP